MCGLLLREENETSDVREFLDLCRSGELYQAMAGDMGRPDAKKAFFYYLYGRVVNDEDRTRIPSRNSHANDETRLAGK